MPSAPPNNSPTPLAVQADATAANAVSTLRGFSDCIAQLLALGPSQPLRAELGEFLQRVRSAGRNADTPGLMQEYAQLQARALQAHGLPNEPGSGGQDSALAGLPVFSSVADTIESALAEMLANIRPPEHAQPALEQARKILGGGLNWYELAALLEHVEQVLVASIDSGQRELELEQFLHGLNTSLANVGGGVAQINSMTRELLAGGACLDSDIRAGISGISHELDAAGTLEQLKLSVQVGVDKMLAQLDAFAAENGGIQTSYERQIVQLGERINELEGEAERVSMELNLQRQRNQLDALTELPNRAAYVEKIDNEMERFERYQQGFCLVIADIDHFKLVNDNYGHLAGDKVLRLVAKMLHKRLRRVDFIARYGGEEFAIILPATDTANALYLMQQLGVHIRECPFHYNSQPLAITVSFGIAGACAGDTAEQLFARADRALYSAKRAGRDCSVIGTVEPDGQLCKPPPTAGK